MNSVKYINELDINPNAKTGVSHQEARGYIDILKKIFLN